MRRIIINPYLVDDGIVCEIYSKKHYTFVKKKNLSEMAATIAARVLEPSTHCQVIKVSIESVGEGMALINKLATYGVNVTRPKYKTLDGWLPVQE